MRRVTGGNVLLAVVVIVGLSFAVTIEDANDEGQSSWKITGSGVTWHLQKQAGGLSSMIDKDGNDWIGFNRTAAAAGMYRGIPNAVHPGNVFHPGYTFVATTLDPSSDDAHVVINCTSSNEGGWAARWVFFDTYCRFVMTKKSRAYWFLYEGTPGGSFSTTSDWWMDSKGTKKTCNNTHEGDIPSPEWIVFGSPGSNRVLFLHHLLDDNSTDRYYQMSPMTVFGFGRQDLNKFLNTVPDSFHVGFVESEEYNTIKEKIADIEKGPVAAGPAPASRGRREEGGLCAIGFCQTTSSGFSVSIPSDGTHRVSVFDANGKLIGSQTAASAQTYEYGGGSLKPGMYLVRAEFEGRTHSRIFVLWR